MKGSPPRRAPSRQTLPLLLRIRRCVRNFFEYAAPCFFSVLRIHRRLRTRTYVHTPLRKELERFRIFQNVYTWLANHISLLATKTVRYIVYCTFSLKGFTCDIFHILCIQYFLYLFVRFYLVFLIIFYIFITLNVKGR